MNVELIYDADCPNLAAARSQLIKAFAETGVSARWREWERSLPDAPDRARAYGSPTILVDGKDVAGIAPGDEPRACRIYNDGQGNISRIPPLETICLALLRAAPERARVAGGRWAALAASLPAIGAGLLPKLACPLCYPAYAALLSVFGIEFVNYTPYLLPLTVLFLALAMAALALQTRRSGSVMPMVLGAAASFIVLFAKFRLESDWLTTGGLVLFVAAILLGNRTKPTAIAPCPACPAGEDGQHG